MGLFDGFVSILFRLDASGRRVYAPFGTWGGVYEVREDDAERIQRHGKRFWVVWFIAVVVLVMALDWRYVLMAIPIMLAAYFGMAAWHVRQMTRLPVSPRELPRLSRVELERRYSRAVGVPTLISLTIVSLLFVAGGVWMLMSGAPPTESWLVILFFGLCTFSLFRQWRRARS